MSLFKPAVLASAASLCLALACASTFAAEAAVAVPAPSGKAVLASTANTATVVLAGGCFWGVQGVFQHTQGVLQAVSGMPAARPIRPLIPWSVPGPPGTPKRYR